MDGDDGAAAGGAGDTAATVTVVPAGLTFPAAVGETIFAAARRAGLRWPTVCGGQGTCHTCVSHVRAGAEGLAPPDDYERAQLDELVVAGDGTRLACQATVARACAIEVERRGVRAVAAPLPCLPPDN